MSCYLIDSSGKEKSLSKGSNMSGHEMHSVVSG